MKRTSMAPILVCSLMMGSAMAGPRTSGGGDIYVEDFASSAYEVGHWLDTNGKTLHPPVSGTEFVKTLQSALDQDLIQSTDSMLQWDHAPKDAVFTEEDEKIVLYRPHWPLASVPYTGVQLIKDRLVAHELFRRMGLDDNDYQISTQLNLFPLTDAAFSEDALMPSARTAPILIDTRGFDTETGLDGSYYDYDATTNVAWIKLDYHYDTRVGKNTGCDPILNNCPLPMTEVSVHAPDLRYDPSTSQIVYDRDGVLTPCATVKFSHGLFAAPKQVKSTGNCRITASIGNELVNEGYTTTSLPTVQVFFFVSQLQLKP